MATSARTAPAARVNFPKINGVSFFIDDPDRYLEQAHAVSCALQTAAEGEMPLTNELLASVAVAIQTLTHLAAIGLEWERESAPGKAAA
ncbi:MAG: hypothetical protein PGN16_03795 [Sphingomonas phyllosphaerae]|uniref:hypothetical protein n=1 Tax=Sphingomonas phyllosphaerae TaxID=257003 RepID=UPI002FF9DD4F